MSELTEEEKKILRRAYEIRERIKAEELEAGEISLEELEEEEAAMNTKAFSKEGFSKESTLKANASKEAVNTNGQMNQKESVRKALNNAGPKEHRDKNIQQTGNKQKPVRRQAPAENKRTTVKRQEKAIAKKTNVQSRQEIKQQKKARKEKRKNSILHRILKKLLLVLIIIAIILGCVYAFLYTTISKTDYKPYTTSYQRQSDVLTQKGVTNILLVGTDTRVPGSDDTRSDAMIVVSINPYKRRLVMTSILRDSYVNIPGVGQNRINEAYSKGGAPLLIQTIEENYKLGIDYYAQVDFFNFVEVIDAFGGVTINIEQPEVEYINGYVSEYNHIIGAPERDQFVDEMFPGGVITLTGRQALGYSRIRKIGNDFGRTQRQRTVMNALLDKVKKANIFTVYKAVDSILPDLSTNIPDSKMCSLMMNSLIYLNYDTIQARVPADGTWSNAIMGSNQEVLAVDFEANKNYLKATIYD